MSASRNEQARQAADALLGSQDGRTYGSISSSSSATIPPDEVPFNNRACYGYMSDVRRTFCLIVTFDLILTFILWVMYVKLKDSTGDFWQSFKDDVEHYSFSNSFFDFVFCAAIRFLILIFAYALFRIRNPSAIAVYIGAYSDPRTTTFVSCVEYVHQISKPRISANVITVRVTILLLVILTLVFIIAIIRRNSTNKNESENKNVEQNALCVDGKLGSKRADKTGDFFLGNILLNHGLEQLVDASLDMKSNRKDTHATSVKCIPQSKPIANPITVLPNKSTKNRMKSSDMIRNTRRNSDSCRNDGALKQKFDEHNTGNCVAHVHVVKSKSRIRSQSAHAGIKQAVDVDIHSTNKIATVKKVSTARTTPETENLRKLEQSNDERIEATYGKSRPIDRRQFPLPLEREIDHPSTHHPTFERRRAEKSGPSMLQITKTEIIYESLGEKNIASPVICEYARINKRHC